MSKPTASMLAMFNSRLQKTRLVKSSMSGAARNAVLMGGCRGMTSACRTPAWRRSVARRRIMVRALECCDE